MAQFLALVRRNLIDFSEADFAPLLEREAEQVRVLHAGGAVRQIWGRKDVPGAVLMIEASDAAEAHAVVQTLPLAANGMLHVEVIELGAYRGFAPRA